MMNYRTIKAAIEAILLAAQGSNFVTIGNQRNRDRADDAIDNNRTVQVYYRSGNFPKKHGTMSGSSSHEMSFRLEFTAAKRTEADLSILDDPGSTNLQRATAIADAKPAGTAADESMDELFDLVYQVVMAANNYDMGLAIGTVTDRWIDNFEKGDTVPQGDIVVLSGQAILTCTTEEVVTGESPDTRTPVDFDSSIENTRDNIDDPVDNTGVFNSN